MNGKFCWIVSDLYRYYGLYIGLFLLFLILYKVICRLNNFLVRSMCYIKRVLKRGDGILIYIGVDNGVFKGFLSLIKDRKYIYLLIRYKYLLMYE